MKVEFIKATINDVDEVYDVIKEAFPYSERRAKYEFISLIKKETELVYKIFFDNKFVGVFCYFEFSDFNFLEYFAIKPSFRNKGIGELALKKFVDEFMKTKKKYLILEVEEPTDKLKERRVEFYRRNGFKLNDFEYFQPNYHYFKPVKMKIMSYNQLIDPNDFDVVSEIYYKVYSRQMKNCSFKA